MGQAWKRVLYEPFFVVSSYCELWVYLGDMFLVCGGTIAKLILRPSSTCSTTPAIPNTDVGQELLEDGQKCGLQKDRHLLKKW